MKSLNRRSVVVLLAAAFVGVAAGWSVIRITAQPHETGDLFESDTMNILRSTSSVTDISVSTWQEAAALIRSFVGEWRVANRPLVTVAESYNVNGRVIHNERTESTVFPVRLPDEQWRRRLSPAQYRIIRRSGTERPYSSELDRNYRPGIYYSRATGQPLFRSEDKFDSRTGWPSFTKPITPDAVAYFEDRSFFSRRIEVVDSLSGAHLGHVFNDGPGPTYQRYCINGEALIFVPAGEDPPALLVPVQ